MFFSSHGPDHVWCFSASGPWSTMVLFFLRLRRRRHTTKRMMSAMTTTPPTAAPAMMPVEELLASAVLIAAAPVLLDPALVPVAVGIGVALTRCAKILVSAGYGNPLGGAAGASPFGLSICQYTSKMPWQEQMTTHPPPIASYTTTGWVYVRSGLYASDHWKVFVLSTRRGA